MQFEIKELDNVLKKLDSLGGCITKAAVSGMNKTLQDITTDAKMNAPVNTGQLRESYQPYYESHQAKVKDGIISGAAGTNVEYAPYVEFGTGPIGEGTPVSGKYPGPLAYTQKGWTYYSEKGYIDDNGQLQHFVHTRGQPAQPTLYPAEQAHAKELPENIKKAAEAEIRRLAK